MHYLMQTLLMIPLITIGVYGNYCENCINYDLCPEALNLTIHNFSVGNFRLIKHALCGFNNTGERPVLKVCCSALSDTGRIAVKHEISEDERIDNHINLKLLPKVCGEINSNRIIGGKSAEMYEFPWMALISYITQEGMDFKCGGSIINKRYILTAAHCVYNKTIAGVRVGEYDINNKIDCQGGVCEKHIQDIPVEMPVIHEEYSLRSYLNDIALLRLGENIDFSHRNVRQICLPTTSQLRHLNLSNKYATVTGWGMAESHTTSSVLRKAEIPVLSSQECREILIRYKRQGDLNNTTKELCAGTLGKGTCAGDSGGPLIIDEKYKGIFRYVQYGIVSYGPANCGSKLPGVYTDVTKYMDWILDNISS